MQARNNEEDLSAGETDFLAKVSEILYSTTVCPAAISCMSSRKANGLGWIRASCTR